MKWDALEEEPCSVARTVAVIGDRWSLLILRECFLRKRRFEAFHHPPSAGGALEEIGALRCVAPDPVPGIAKAL